MKNMRRVIEITGTQEPGEHELVVTAKGLYLRKRGARNGWRFAPFDEVWFATQHVEHGPVAEKAKGRR